MPRGRKKNRLNNNTSFTRQGSEESMDSKPPKVKDSRIEGPESFESENKFVDTPMKKSSKITDYFSSSSPQHQKPQPQQQQPQQEAPSSSSSTSDKSEAGDSSGKENEVDDSWRNDRSSGTGTTSSMKQLSSSSLSTNNDVIPESKLTVVTRSRAAKMPLSSSFAYPDNISPPPSPTKTASSPVPPPPPSSAASTAMTSPPTATAVVSAPTSPPTPHKIKLMTEKTKITTATAGTGTMAPAASALNKLKISLKPKKTASTSETSSETSSTTSSTSTTSVVATNAQLAATTPPTQANKKRITKRRGRINRTATTSTTNTSTNNANKSAPSSKSATAKSTAASKSHKVTEYFPIRRSERKPKNELDREELAKIESILMSTEDDTELDLTVKNYPDKGRGIMTLRDYTKGEFVVEYAGDLVELDIAKERESKYSRDLSTGCYMYYFKHKGKQYCVDATKESGRLGRLVNHSRIRPNLVTKVVMVKDTPRLILVARNDIAKGTELLYDYGDRSKESLKAHPWLAL